MQDRDVAWPEFEARLADSLGSLPPDAYLVLEVHAPAGHGAPGGTLGAPFVQFAREGSSLLTEAAGNSHVAADLRLDPGREAILAAMGWEPPWPGVAHRGNWSRRWRGRVPFAAVAAVAVRTLRDVYGVVSTADIRCARFARDGRTLPDPGLQPEAVGDRGASPTRPPGPPRLH